MNVEVSVVVAGSAGAPRPRPGAAATAPAAPAAEEAAGLAAPEAAPAPAPLSEQARAAGEAIRSIKDWLPEPVRTKLSFRIDEDLDRVIVSVVDSESGTVLRQIPADVVLRVAQNLQDFMSGFVDEVA